MERFLSWDHHNNFTIYYKIYKTYSTVSTPTLNTEKLEVVCIIDLGTKRRRQEVWGWGWQEWRFPKLVTVEAREKCWDLLLNCSSDLSF